MKFMNKKTLTILGIVLLTIIAGSFWFVKNSGEQKTKSNVIPTEVEESTSSVDGSQNVQNTNTSVIPAEAGIQEEASDILYNPDGTIDTSNWQTYRNEEYGFEVRYPEDWVAEDYITACIGLADCAIDCKKTPDRCNIKGVSFYEKSNKISSAVSITFIEDEFYEYKTKKGNNNKNSEWLTGMFSGCHITAMRHSGDVSFLFGSFEDIDLSDEKKVVQFQNLCENNLLNPFFDEIVKSFTIIK